MWQIAIKNSVSNDFWPTFVDSINIFDFGFLECCKKWEKREDNKQIETCNGVARTQKKLRTSKGNYWIKQWFSSIDLLFKMETSLKGKNLLP